MAPLDKRLRIGVMAGMSLLVRVRPGKSLLFPGRSLLVPGRSLLVPGRSLLVLPGMSLLVPGKSLLVLPGMSLLVLLCFLLPSPGQGSYTRVMQVTNYEELDVNCQVTCHSWSGSKFCI